MTTSDCGGTPSVRPPSPAMWYNANGHEWGQIGPNGERLDPNGDPLPEERPSMAPVLAILLVMAGVTALILWAAWVGKFDSPSPQVTPAPYGYPCQVK